jgi:hypothetical protein
MSKKQTKSEETFRLTLKGLLSIYLQEAKASEVYNAIELYCRRNGMGIAINENNTLDFVQMQQVEETK